jgi:hypothetical protein
MNQPEKAASEVLPEGRRLIEEHDRVEHGGPPEVAIGLLR